MDITRAVAINAKAIREQKKLTLDAAAELTGVSRSMLAQIEKGDVNPTISVVWKIANGYKVSFTSLIADSRESASVVRLEAAKLMEEDGGRYRNYLTFMFGEDRPFECCRIEIEPEGRLEAQPHLKGTEEYLMVFSGTVEVTAGAEKYVLSPGDSMRFQADQPHSYRNAGPDTVKMSMVIYYNK